MKQLKVLRQRVNDLRKQGKEKVREFEALKSKAERTAEEEARLEALDAELTRLEGEVEAADLELQRAEQEEHRKALLVTFGDPRLGPRALGGDRRSYAAMFGTPSPAGITAEEWFRGIHTGMWRPGIQAAMVEGTGSDGGFAVPQEFAARMLDLSLENEIVRPRARVEPMLSDTRKVAGFDNTSHAGGTIGGFKVIWAGEGQSLTKQKGILRAIELKAKKPSILVEASNELLSDGGQTFESLLENQLTQGLGWGMDDAFLNGKGGAQPLGALNDPACITVEKESGQPAGTIVYENLVKMFSRLHPALINGSVWVANTTCLPQLLTLQQKITNVAGGENVGGSWVPVLREDGSGNMTLLTRPLLLTEKLPVLGSSGDIILANFSQYVIGIRNALSLAKSAHVGFESDTTMYRIIARIDGMGSWKGPMIPKSGSTTLSWIVKLEERA